MSSGCLSANWAPRWSEAVGNGSLFEAGLDALPGSQNAKRFKKIVIMGNKN